MGETLGLQGPIAKQDDFFCQQLLANDIEAYWPEMLLELRKISHVWNQWWTEEALYLHVISGHMQVWVAGKPPAFNLVTFTQILTYPANLIFQIVLMFGTKVDETLPVIVGTLEHFAAENGCRYAEVVGRMGWSRKLERYGFRRSAMLLTKPIGELRRH